MAKRKKAPFLRIGKNYVGYICNDEPIKNECDITDGLGFRPCNYKPGHRCYSCEGQTKLTFKLVKREKL